MTYEEFCEDHKETIREIHVHCEIFCDIKGVPYQRHCSRCEAGEDECWNHYVDTVLRPRWEAGQ